MSGGEIPVPIDWLFWQQRSIFNSCLSGTQFRVISNWSHGSGLVSQVPCLGNGIGVVRIRKKYRSEVF